MVVRWLHALWRWRSGKQFCCVWGGAAVAAGPRCKHNPGCGPTRARALQHGGLASNSTRWIRLLPHLVWISTLWPEETPASALATASSSSGFSAPASKTMARW
eukprot:357202-Chlamydomonas_euryale.AAC.7